MKQMKIIIITVVILIISLKLYKSKIKGYIGEKLVIKKLKKLNKRKYKVINDVLLKTQKGSTQIDHIVISKYGIFVIETKNYKGIIKGNEYDDNWSQILINKSETLRNPIKQNNGHIKALKDLIPEFRYKNIKSIILFTKRAKLKVNCETSVTYFNKVNKIIKKYRNEEFTKEDVERIYNKINELNINSFKERKTHVKNVKRNIKQAKRSIRKNRCPRCGGKLKKKTGKYGKFKGCKNYPQCTFKMNL
ncbi:nuclease-related domain-containing protein [Clostridioides difficile]